MNDHLANDRTFLAWLRTTIALFGLGFVVSKVALIVDADANGNSPALYSTVGVLIVLCGAVVINVGYRQHVRVTEEICAEGGLEAPPTGWTRAFTVTSSVGAVVLAVLIIVTT